MQIIAVKPKKDGTGTVTFKAHEHKDGAYKVYPKGSNKAEKAVVLYSLKEVATWLESHQGWGVRMSKDSTVPPSIITKGIQILRS